MNCIFRACLPSVIDASVSHGANSHSKISIARKIGHVHPLVATLYRKRLMIKRRFFYVR